MQETEKIGLPDEWLVIGSGSLVGSRFIDLGNGSSNIHAAGGESDRSNERVKSFCLLDVTDRDQVSRLIHEFPGKYVINFAGATLVEEIEKDRPIDPTDQSQLDQNMAYRVNVLGTRNIAQACKREGKFPIFISTGFVFDGKNGPYSEDDPIATDPTKVSWYAWTKVLAEKEVENAGIEHLMVRISYPYRSQFEGKSDFARNFLNLYDGIEKGDKQWFPIFADQTLTPTFIDDLPKAVLTLVENKATGTYHVTSPTITTPYEFCCELLSVARGVEDSTAIVSKGSIRKFMEEHPNLPKKPINGGEKTDKIQAIGFTPTDWKTGIQKAFDGTT